MVRKGLAGIVFSLLVTSLFWGGNKLLPQKIATAQVAEDFMLLDHKGVAHDLYLMSAAKAVLLTSYARGDDSVSEAVKILKALQNSEAGKRTVNWMIDATGSDPEDIDIPILLDEAQIISRSLGLTRIPETVVIFPDKGWKIAYRGPPEEAVRFLGGEAGEASSPLSKNKIPYVNDEGLTYTKDIASILQERCLWCHRPGSFPPENIDGYAQVREWSAMIRETVRKKLMPPWKADGRYGNFLNDVSMGPDETRKLISWIESGMKRGEGDDPLLSKKKLRRGSDKRIRQNRKQQTPDLVLKVPRKSKIPPEGFGRYQYFPVGEPFSEEVWVQAIKLETNVPSQLHHGSMIVVPPTLVSQLKEGAKMAGRMANYMSGQVVKNLVWAPGKPQVFRFPPRTALKIERGSQIVLELHYTGIGREMIDQARLKLFFHKDPVNVKPLQTLLMRNHELLIPAYAKDFPVRTPDVVLERDIMATTYLPHMHMRGRSIKTTAHYPDGTSEILVSIPRYDFNWQKGFVLREPKFLPKGTRLVTEARYDNSSGNPNNPDPASIVKWGHRSDGNEMCNMNIAYFFAD